MASGISRPGGDDRAGTTLTAGGIFADERCRHTAAVDHRHFDAGRIVDHVAVGQDQPVRSKNESRAASLPLPRLTSPRAPNPLMHLDIDYRRTYALDCARDRGRIGIKQRGIRRTGSILPMVLNR